jgi:hypothetical protein
MHKCENVHSERNLFLLYFEYVSIKLGVKTKSQLTIKIQLSTLLQPSFYLGSFKKQKKAKKLFLCEINTCQNEVPQIILKF